MGIFSAIFETFLGKGNIYDKDENERAAAAYSGKKDEKDEEEGSGGGSPKFNPHAEKPLSKPDRDDTPPCYGPHSND